MKKLVKLNSICSPKQWKTIPTSKLKDSGYKVYGANGVIGFYHEYNHENPTITITCRGATCGTINLTEPFSYITGNSMCLDSISEFVKLKYLYYTLKAYDFAKVISGSAQPQITREGLEKVFVYVYPLIEQDVIIEKFDKITVLISKRKEQLAKLDELAKSRFIEMFGDPISNSKGWEITKLEDLGELSRGISKSRPRNLPELLGGKYPLVQTGDVANSELYITRYNSTYSELGLKQSKMWKAGTLCITIAANIAKTAILKFDACFPDSIVGFKSNGKTNQIFIHYIFSFFQELLESQAPTVAQKNINLQTLQNLMVICPPSKFQNDFESFIQQLDKSKFRMKKCLKLFSYIRHLRIIGI